MSEPETLTSPDDSDEPAVGEYDRRLQSAAEKSGHPVAAVAFVVNCLAVGPYTPEAVDNHLTASDLCRIFLEMAMDTFQEKTMEVLAEWRIERSEDLARIVAALDAEGLSKASDDDRIEDFDNVFDLKQQRFSWASEGDEAERQQREERESKLIFAVMSIAGAVFAVLCIAFALRTNGQPRVLLMSLGVAAVVVPIFLLALISYGYRRVKDDRSSA